MASDETGRDTARKGYVSFDSLSHAEKSNSGGKKNRRDVELDFVEEPGIRALLDGVGAVNANGLPGGGGSGLVHGAFDAVGHELSCRELVPGTPCQGASAGMP